MTMLLAAGTPFTGSGMDPLDSLVVAGLSTLVLMVWLVRYASRRSRNGKGE
jgi:hypothetical protein